MRIKVQKFGGTSLSTLEAREQAVRHIQKACSDHDKVIVVVSAMGRMGDPYATDTLLDWIQSNGNALPDREKDILLSCGEMISAATLCSLLHSHSIQAQVLTGPQAGIKTDGMYGEAKIESVDPTRIYRTLEQYDVVVITGFQGRYDEEITTLGRGGSDTSAIAIGAAVHAESIDIFTDVNGVMTTDPKIVKEAKLLDSVTYAEISNLANQGAKVIHPRAVEIARHANIPLRIRSTFSDDAGTIVTSPERQDMAQKSISDRFITGLAHTSNISQIEISSQQAHYDLQLKIFKTMAQHQISVDFINVNPSGIVYTVFDHEAEKAIRIIKEMGYEPKYLSGCTKIAVVGGGMNGVPGIMATIVEALLEENIEILQSADSNTTIWVLVKNNQMTKALQALHRKFKLHQ